MQNNDPQPDSGPDEPAGAASGARQPVDIIVPVYRGLASTRACLESVLAANCQTPWRLVVINDASPEAELRAWLRAFAATDARVALLENRANLGFVGTVNRGMRLSAQRDVLLLNSDTEVAPGWLDRLRAAAYSDEKVASVTPFSNNATICSYPRFCQDNALPDGWDTARLDALFARVGAGQVLDLPTGVGFCMYIRRAALDEIGLFDEASFGAGYGEENDFCMRAQAAGWRNLHALDVFVHHSGGVSFGDSKSKRERAAMDTLRGLHRSYEARVLRFLRDDPARLMRTKADVARIRENNLPVILAVSHDREGGTARHIIELATHLRQKAQFLVLRPAAGGRVRLQLASEKEGFELVFKLPDEGDALVAVLRGLKTRHVHFHHLLGHQRLVTQLPELLRVRYDFTVHDYYTWCMRTSLTGPDGGYCGEDGSGQCLQCQRRNPVAHHESIADWRRRHVHLLNAARHVLAPSLDTLERLRKIAPDARLRWVPHTDVDLAHGLPVPAPAPLANDRPLRVAVIGALSAIKGADLLEQVAVAARRRGAPVTFHLLGQAYRALKVVPRANLMVHGRYAEPELPALLDHLKPDLVWFPAQWPETYSYTLSACLQNGWPVVAPDIGAFAQRLSGRRWSWICPWHQDADEWLAFFMHLRASHFQTGESPPPVAHAATDKAVPPELRMVPSPEWYADEYLVGLPATAAMAPSADLLAAGLPRRHTDFRTRARGQALDTLVHLRNTRVLATVARAIPPHWQTRVKNWLRR
ncbi:MAG: glycosyltransferase [Ottowia sp.]|nr:glycosyltransferase [Ottowia sp.]